MRRLRKRDPIVVVVLLDRTWKARVTATGRGRVFFHVPAFDDGSGLRPRSRTDASAPLREEGKTWARGWDTEEARALQTAWAL